MNSISSVSDDHERYRRARQLGIFLGIFFVVWSVRATILYGMDESFASPMGKALYTSGVKCLIWVVPAAVFAAQLRGASPMRYLGLRPFPAWRTWLPCLFATCCFLALLMTVELGGRGRTVDASRLGHGSPLDAILAFVFTPLVEEVLFRGLVLHELMALTSWSRANATASLLFVGVHLPHWLWRDGATLGVAINAVGVFVFSFLAGWLYAKSRSVWPPALAHALNNLLATLLSG